MTLPETRASLLVLRPVVAAADELVEIYEPLLIRLPKLNGFQQTDFQEIVDKVLIGVLDLLCYARRQREPIGNS